VDFDAGIADRAGDHGQGDPLEQRKVDVGVQPLGLESGEPAGHREQLFAYRSEIVQAFLEAEIGQVVGACLIALIGGELLVLLDEGVAIVGAKDVMAVFDLFHDRVQLALQPFGDTLSEHLKPFPTLPTDLGNRSNRFPHSHRHDDYDEIN